MPRNEPRRERGCEIVRGQDIEVPPFDERRNGERGEELVQAGRHALGPVGARLRATGASEMEQVVGLDVVELQHPGQGLDVTAPDSVLRARDEVLERL